MIRTDNIRDAFFRRTIERDFKTVLQRQLKIAEERVYQKGNNRQTGRLRSFLSSSSILISTNPVSVRINYPIYIRFLDMRKNGNLRIYNSQLWGMIYRETLPELRYGMTKEVRREIGLQLENLFPE